MSSIPQPKKGFAAEPETPFEDAFNEAYLRFLSGEDVYSNTGTPLLIGEMPEPVVPEAPVAETVDQSVGDALEDKLDLLDFQKKVMGLALNLFDGDLDTSFRLSVNGSSYQDTFYTPETGVTIDMTVREDRSSNGLVELYLADGFLDKVAGAASFVSAVANYLGYDTGYKDTADLIDAAYEKLPDIASSKTQYKLTFRFDADNSNIGFDVSIPEVKVEKKTQTSIFGPDDVERRECFRYGSLCPIGVGSSGYK